jgi:integrase
MKTEQDSEVVVATGNEDWNQGPGAPSVAIDLAVGSEWPPSFWLTKANLERLKQLQAGTAVDARKEAPPEHSKQSSLASTDVADFVEQRFIPEFVANKRSAGRAHFQAILKHVLPPERVARAFAINPVKGKSTLSAIPGWPYIDSLALCEINAAAIEGLITAALTNGYSIQTATHIRNVIRAIFSHAIRTGSYAGPNPAARVNLPPMSRKETPVLTFAQLKQLLGAMRYPEREFALLAMLTDMNVAEICGLQWKYLNLSNLPRMIDQEFVPPKVIAVRNQSYRGEVSDVIGKRRRFVRISDSLGSVLRGLRNRSQLTRPKDYVFASRNGTPIHPENIAARRLKSIGKSLDMPWLTWAVFQRSRGAIQAEVGGGFHEELEKIDSPRRELTPEMKASREAGRGMGVPMA